MADSPNKSQRESTAMVFPIVFLMLCGLTGLSFWIANSALMDNRGVAWLAMIAVSIAKASLVVMFFMHLWWEKQWKYALTVPALIMGILLVVLLIPDIGLRTQTYSRERQKFAPVADQDAQANDWYSEAGQTPSR